MSEGSALCQRIALGVEYDGTDYHGWQSQPHAANIQDTLNAAISVVANEPIQCVGAGRTDAGVHASEQVVHFDAPVRRSDRSWLLGINSNLPDDISVQWVVPVAADFHARFSAVSRSYEYLIHNSPVRSALHRERVWWVRQPLSLARMQEGACHLLGKHDFSSFRAAACQSHTPVRTVTQMELSQAGEFIQLKCSANAFLHHMVRNIVGSLVRVGTGEEAPAWIKNILEAQDRTVSGIKSPATGLTLTRVDYPDGSLDVSDLRRGAGRATF